VAARLGAPERRAAKNVGRGELTRFAGKRLCEINFLFSAMPQEKPRLEATLAGFDNRSPRAGRPPPVSRREKCHPKSAPSAGLRLKPRENLVKAHLVIGTAGMLPRCGRSAQGARWGDPTNTDATPRSAWRWQASSMTRKLGPPCCTWRRCGSAWQARGSSRTQRRPTRVRAARERLLRRPRWRACPRLEPCPP